MTYERVGLTTVDNPFNPLTEFADWFRFDCDKGYYSCGYLARLANTSDALSDIENNKEVERAVDQIVLCDPLGIYKKVTETVEVPD